VVPQQSVRDPYLGTIIAERYRLERKLGEGGMGMVYQGQHVVLEKPVAVKILAEDLARRPDLVQRFLQEAKAASRIHHENVVDITDFGQTASGTVFFVMELLEGRDLATLIRQEVGPIPWPRAKPILIQVCRALAAAHAKGIIHRDMKPENVFLVTREGTQDFVKVVDFGIAKMVGLDESSGPRLTRTGMIFGTPEYMSPEQAQGTRPDHRVDIYAVGVMMYEMLTGQVPFRADTFMGVLTKHMFEAPVPPSKLRPDLSISPELDAIVLKALAKDREKRFQTMAEMGEAIARVSGGPHMAFGAHPGADPDTESQSSAAAQAGENTELLPSLDPALPLPRRRSHVGFFVTLAAVLLLLGGAGFYFFRLSGSEGALEPSAGRTPSGQAQSGPGASGKEALPKASTPDERAGQAPSAGQAFDATAVARVEIVVRTRPEGAEIVRDGVVLGRSPVTLKLERGSQEIRLQLRRSGYAEKVVHVLPDKDREIDVELAALRNRTGQQPVKKKEEDSQLSDLKNPF